MGKARKNRRVKETPTEPGPDYQLVPSPAPAPPHPRQPPCTCKFWYLVVLVLVSFALMTWALYLDRWSASDGVVHGVFSDRSLQGRQLPLIADRQVPMALIKTGLAIIMPMLGIQAVLFLRGLTFTCFNVFTVLSLGFVPLYYVNTSGLEEMLPSYFLSVLALAPLLLILALAP